MGAHAALSLVAREPFIGPGTLTSTSPGSNFSSVSGTFTLVRVGPSASAKDVPGWSADLRTTGSVNFRGTINLSGAAGTCGLWGTWVRIKYLPSTDGYVSILQLFNRSNTNVVADVKVNGNGNLTVSPFNYGGAPVTFTGPVVTANTWIWVAVAWQIQSGSNSPYGIRCMSQTLGGSLNIWGSADGLCALDTSFSSVNVGLQTGGTGPELRVGCPSLYAMSSFSDVAYPSDIIAPVEQSYNWYVNPVSGNDSNDGSTPSTAWKTAAKVNLESQYCGMLDSNALGPGGGDVLTIDTSSGALVIGPNALTFSTLGLKVQPASGQTYIKCQAEEFLANSAFTATPGLSHTYQTADTQTNIVAWENDEWMWHVQAASYASTATVTNPVTGTYTSFTSAGAALDATPGSFYTDGTTLYIHPFNNTNPITDGNVYTRSMNRNQASAVVFTAGNYLADGFYIRKTTLVDSSNDDFGAYCFQDDVSSGTGMNSEVLGGYFAYGDKHCFGSTSGVTNSTLLVLNTECEQGHPYCGYGGQTPFVSYTGPTTGDITHIYRGCTCLKRSGLIGSAAGDPLGTGGDIILSHNNGGGISFASIAIDGCNFASGNIDIGAATNLVVGDETQAGGVTTYCPNTTVQDTTFSSPFPQYTGVVQMGSGASNLTMTNCLVKPTFALGTDSVTYYGMLLAGTATVEGCTFDLSNISGNSAAYFPQGFIQRTGPLNLTFRNNAYLVPSGENFPLLYGATNSDTITFDHNAYNLGSGTTLVRDYGNGAASLTFAQWQSVGQDCINSTLNASLQLQNDVPQSGSPLLNAGVDFGPATDVTGTVYQHRDTIGAYEGSAAYLAPQSVTGLPPTTTLPASPSDILPATTAGGLALTYSVVSGPARLSGDTLTFTGTGTVTLMATQAGNNTYAPFSEVETITVTAPDVDTPTLPPWGLALLGALLAVAATRSKRTASDRAL